MIRKFSVKNFANFKDTLTVDLTHVHDYKYNEDCVKNGLVNKVIIYGKNSAGKTNLGMAVCDIAVSIFSSPSAERKLFKNADTENGELMEFSYSFLLDGDTVDYSYKKADPSTIVFERFSVNNELIFEYDLQEGYYDFSNVSRINAEKLDWQEFKRVIAPKKNILAEAIEQPSALRYIISNTIQNEDSVIYRLTRFLKGMRFSGSMPRLPVGFSQQIKKMIDNESLYLFQDFLNKHGVDCRLTMSDQTDGEKEIYFDYKKPLPFFEFMSSGTAELTHFYFSHIYNMSRNTFIYLDEFDAHYHFELSKNIVTMLERLPGCQVIMTTHNTNLLDNSIMRPDCFMVLANGKLTPLCEATTRELRQGHDLEKLYINGEFDE